MKLFEIEDINSMEYLYSKKAMQVLINGIVEYQGKETSILIIPCSYELYCEKYLEFVKLKR